MKDQLGSWAFTQGAPTLDVFKSPKLKYSGNPLTRNSKRESKNSSRELEKSGSIEYSISHVNN